VILKGVSTSNAVAPVAESNVTVIVVDVVVPSPALILDIPTSLPLEPTILNSSILGQFWQIHHLYH